jgi:hypothetical protein
VPLGIFSEPLYGFVCEVILLQLIFCISLLAFLLGDPSKVFCLG